MSKHYNLSPDKITGYQVKEYLVKCIKNNQVTPSCKKKYCDLMIDLLQNLKKLVNIDLEHLGLD